MRTGKIKITVLWLTVLLLTALSPMSVYAADTGTPDDTVRVEIPVCCTGKNTSENFEYRLFFEPVDSQKIENDTLSLKDGEEGSFAITYDQPGTYHYTVSQKKGTDEKIRYDSTVYQVDVYVTEEQDGRLSDEVVAYLQGETGKKAKLDFINEKELPGKVPEKHSGTDGGSGQVPEEEQIPEGTQVQTGKIRTGDEAQIGRFTVMTAFGAVMAGLATLKKRREVV